MKILILFLSIILFSSSLFSNQSFAIDFVDSTGYTPSWAKGSGYQSVLLKCTELVGDYSRDGDWCMEWVAYVLDQGEENFPKSTQKSGSYLTVKPNDLVGGDLYSGPLEKFLPKSSFYEKSWVISPPYQNDLTETSVSIGIEDHVTQALLVPDYNGKKAVISAILIFEFEDTSKAKNYFEQNKVLQINKIKSSPNMLNLSEYYLLDFADCYGSMKDPDTEKESASLSCVKGIYLITLTSSLFGGYVTSPEIEDVWVDTTVVEITKEVLRKIPNSISIPSSKIIEETTLTTDVPSVNAVPEWIKNNAGWWSSGVIDDKTFLNGVQYLIKEGIIDIPLSLQKTISEKNDFTNEFELSRKELILPSDGKVENILLTGNIPNHKVGFPLNVILIQPDGASQKFPASLTQNGDYRGMISINENSLTGLYEIHLSHNGAEVGFTSFTVLSTSIPDWIKNSAGWWAQEIITEGEFVNAVEYLVENGIISVARS